MMAIDQELDERETATIFMNQDPWLRETVWAEMDSTNLGDEDEQGFR